jgi:hypothetical protein
MRVVLGASMIGTVIEWYDFLIYGTAAALVFNKLFFPSFAPAAGTLAAFGTYAVGFVARPLGGAVFGHFGDRLGRKVMLMLTLLITGGGTFLIGCLPTYTQIGLWAPVLLVILRYAQSSAGGGRAGSGDERDARDRLRDRRGLDAGAARHARPLQRRIIWLPGVGGVEWWLRSDHCDRVAGMGRRDMAGVAVSCGAGFDRGGCRGGGAGDACGGAGLGCGGPRLKALLRAFGFRRAATTRPSQLELEHR